MLKDALVAAFRAMPAADPAHYVRGQHEGYRRSTASRRIPRPRPSRRLRLEIDNWRWSGVPFFIRTGKCLPITQTELRVVFQRPPKLGSSAGRGPRAEPARGQARPVDRDPLLVDAQRHESVEPEQITLDMEFAAGGRRGPDAVRGPAARGADRRQQAVHAPGRGGAVLEGDGAAARAPTAGASVREGLVGPGGADEVCRRRPLARAMGGVMSTAANGESDASAADGESTGGDRSRQAAGADEASRAPRRRRRSRRSPTTRSCRTAIRARWSRPTARSTGCACRALTRRACSDRCSTAAPGRSGSARSGSTSRAAALYEPGTNTLVTSWKTPTGWAIVRDALTMGPRRGEDTITPHTRPPADEDAEHMLVRTVACVEGSVEIELVCEPGSTTAACPASGR